MTGTVSPAIPTVGQNDSSEEPKIPSALITLRDALNAILTSSNDVDGAQIGTGTIPNSALATLALSKLVAGTNAQIPISNGTSYQSKSLSGDVTVDNTGVTTIGANTVGPLKLSLAASNDNLGADITSLTTFAYAPVATLAVATSASYLVFGQVQFSQQTVSVGSASVVRVGLNFNGSIHESPNITVVGDQVVPLSLAIAATNTTLSLDAKSISGGAVDVKGTTGSGFSFTRLCAIRYA